MTINLLICLLSIGCTIIVMDTINRVMCSRVRLKTILLLKQMLSILMEADEVDRLLDSDEGEYISSGYLLEDENYFKLCNILADLTEVNK